MLLLVIRVVEPLESLRHLATKKATGMHCMSDALHIRCTAYQLHCISDALHIKCTAYQMHWLELNSKPRAPMITGLKLSHMHISVEHYRYPE